VDGVLADFVALCLDYVARNYGLRYERSAIDQWDCMAAMGFPKSEWKLFGERIGPMLMCRRMPLMQGAVEFYAKLVRLGEVKVATTPFNAVWLTQRAEWLEEFGIPIDRQIHIHEKQDLACGMSEEGWEILIDDKVENCVAFVEAGGRAFCIAAPYNNHCPDHIERGSHADCLEFVRALSNRPE
jgi:hypothetical protein